MPKWQRGKQLRIRLRGISLADGNSWDIAAGNEQAASIVSHFTEAMQFQQSIYGRRLLVLVGDHNENPLANNDMSGWLVPSSETEDTIVCTLKHGEDDDTLALQLMQVSLVIGLHAQFRGGLLLHGALAERDGEGLILAGSGGIGKTTASLRLESPWRSLCDDLTLVVRDKQGTYWAHPWPTWSRFVSGGPGGTWNVQYAVPLKGIFFLIRAHEDLVEPLGGGQAVCLLVESAEQVWWWMSHRMGAEKIRPLRLQRFENICALAQVVPCHLLRLSLTGAFWQEIEKVIVLD